MHAFAWAALVASLLLCGFAIGWRVCDAAWRRKLLALIDKYENELNDR